jgi:hypothetical protein
MFYRVFGSSLLEEYYLDLKMTVMKIGIQEQEKSNQFLRALWAEIRSRDPDCVWQYCPIKRGEQKTISFGFLHLMKTEKVYAGITYERKGGIESIIFDHIGDKSTKTHLQIEDILQQSLESARQKYETPHLITVTGYLRSQHIPLLADYSGERFSIKHHPQIKSSSLTIGVLAYDDLDALTLYTKIAYRILHFLSIETNISFQLRNVAVNKEDKIEMRHENKYFEDPDWLDGWPKVDELLYISEEGAEFIDWIAKGQDDHQERKKFLLACRHFYAARKTHSDEVVTVLCMSALEVASNLRATNAAKCENCGQPVYKIGKRVAEFVDRFLPPHIVKFFKEYYKKRSKYLHEGIILEDQSFFHFGKNIPQLNKNHDSGCEIPTQVSVINLWEFTSYCLRSLLRAGLC